MRYVGFLLLIGLVVFCVIEIVNSEDDERLGVHPALWVLAVLLVPVLGSIIWLAVSRSRRSAARARRPGWGDPAGPSGAPAAPDDDEEFLWRLEQERKRRARSQDADEPPHDAPGPA
ncbi:PLDc N-terminal domain-containing protein [Cellulomonas sp.]|uniref:PLDc N-terminal domain-containing protein n=1 Tax=Cellulomonas sp. TaxID=40001 RepID=UPI002583B4FF|nr:PLDc N-terminal domain-containing protein [Cellulomonas sp.]MCR6687910.1 PLDc N-terminal domain-containing protein [Cellulomonas sp.]